MADDDLILVEIYGLRAGVKRDEFERWSWGLDVSASQQTLMDSRCSIAVADRRCAREATAQFLRLNLCATHRRVLVDSFRSSLRRDDELLEIARTVVAEFDATERSQQKAERDARHQATSVVYFAERDGFVKIGFSADHTRRLVAIARGQTMPDGITPGPLRLLATLPGARSKERYLHGRFDYLRLGGSEWFLLDDDLWKFIAGLKGYTGEPRKPMAGSVT